MVVYFLFLYFVLFSGALKLLVVEDGCETWSLTVTEET
jgi:hypothetical protein